MRTPLIAGNWKMHTTISDAIDLVKKMYLVLDSIKDIEKVLCPPFISIGYIKEIIKNTTLKLGAQNMFYEEKGAYTGEISPYMLKDIVEYVIIGHSERRQYFGETNEMINKKVSAALNTGLKPILCIGEKLEDREKNRTNEIIAHQISTGLQGIKSTGNLVIAYEPIWAIGTGKPATGQQALNTVLFIRNYIHSIWGKDIADKIRILYGGSVSSNNISEFVCYPEIDGALVGGASLNPDEFISIVKQTADLKKI